MDYVFLSVDPALTQEPRPDLLDKVLRALRTVPGLRWIGRLVEALIAPVGSTSPRSIPGAEAMQPKPDEHLLLRCPFQSSFVGRNMPRVTYDFLDWACSPA